MLGRAAELVRLETLGATELATRETLGASSVTLGAVREAAVRQ